MDVFWNYTRLAYKEKQTSEFQKVYIYTFYNVKGTEKGYCNYIGFLFSLLNCVIFKDVC